MIDSNTAILLDADMLAFAAASATEVEVEFAPDIWTRHSELPAAREYFWNQIDYWCDEYEATRDDVILCFTERSQFRRDLAPSYKANRKGSKPIGIEPEFIWKEKRLYDLVQTVSRYIDSRAVEPKPEWFSEIHKLIGDLQTNTSRLDN